MTEFLATVGLRFTEITRMLGENKESGTPFKEFLQQVCQHIACTLSGALEESARTIGNLRDANSDLEARLSDLWVVRHIWDAEEQQEVLASLVDQAMAKQPASGGDHPRARSADGPDAESIARDLDAIEGSLKNGTLPDVEKSYLRDRLGILEGRCQWVKDGTKREWLLKRAAALWPSLK